MPVDPSSVTAAAAAARACDLPPGSSTNERWLRAIVDRSFELLMVVDADRTVRWANMAFERVLGYKPESLVGRDILPLFHPDDLPGLAETIGRLSAVPGAAATVDARIRAADGSWHQMETAGTNLLDDPAVRGFVVSMRDVTERRQIETSLRESEARYGELFNGARDAVYTADLDGRLRSINPAAERLTGYSHDELLAMNFMELVAPEDFERAGEVLAERLAGDSHAPLELQLVTKDGSRVFVEVTGRVARPDDGPSRLEGIARDTTDRHLLEEQLRDQSLHDGLTGMANRALLRDRLDQALARSERDASHVAVLLLDLDNLKDVNDSLGHQAGDDILVELAGRLRSVLRAGETVARIGGDKFVAVAEGIRDRQQIVALAERVHAVFADRFETGETNRKISGTVGIAVSGAEATASDLLRDADLAMYHTKATAKGGFEFFDGTLRVELLRHLALDDALEEALRNHGLDVPYQPIVSVTGGRILAVEALARWLDPTLGRVQPAEFIPAAEESGMIVQLGRYVIAEAARQAARWRRQLPGTLPLGVFINVSARELADPSFAQFVAQTLNEHDLTAADISFELTERVFIDNDNATISRNLTDLTESGISIVLDDFGTGYSALTSLKRFPLAAVKIDRSFITAIQAPGDDAPIARAIVSLCNTLGLTVIAEGVETKLQLDYLRHLGCEAAQGYLLGRPESASEVSNLLSLSPLSAASERNDAHSMWSSTRRVASIASRSAS